MEAKATVKYVRTTARKARLVADEVRGKRVSDALTALEFGIKKDAADDVSKLIKSAVANLQSKNSESSIDVEGLRVREIFVDEGPTLKRFRPRAQGRGYKILKHMCHMTVTVSK